MRALSHVEKLEMRDPKRVSEVLKTVNPNVCGESVAALCREAAEIIDKLIKRRSD